MSLVKDGKMSTGHARSESPAIGADSDTDP
jgi:hypothetical protein